MNGFIGDRLQEGDPTPFFESIEQAESFKSQGQKEDRNGAAANLSDFTVSNLDNRGKSLPLFFLHLRVLLKKRVLMMVRASFVRPPGCRFARRSLAAWRASCERLIELRPPPSTELRQPGVVSVNSTISKPPSSRPRRVATRSRHFARISFSFNREERPPHRTLGRRRRRR